MKVVIYVTMSWRRLTCEACDTCYYVMAKVVIHVTMSWRRLTCEGRDTCYYVLTKADM